MSFVTAKPEVVDVVTCGQAFLFSDVTRKSADRQGGFQKRKERRTA